MAEVDTSIYSRGAPKPIDPMASMTSAVGIPNAMNQNRLFGQTFEARKAIGDAYQKSIDPETGKLDTNKLMKLTAQNPNSAFMAGDVATQAQTREHQQLQIDQSRQALAVAHVKAVDQAAGALLNTPDLNMSHYTDAIVKGVTDGRWSPQVATQLITSAAQAVGGKKGTEETSALKGLVNEQRMRNLSSIEQVGVTNPTPQVVDVGGSKKIIQTPQVGPDGAPGTPTILGEMPNTMTVGEKLQRVPMVGPNNQQMSVPQASLATPTGDPMPAQGGGQPSPLGTGRMPAPQAADTGSDAPPAAAGGGAAPAAAAAPGTPAGALPTGLAPGTEAAADVTARSNAEQGVALNRRADTVPEMKGLLGNMESLVKAGDFRPGPGAEQWREIKAGANRVLGAPLFDSKSIASQEEFGKLAVQVAQAQFKALGGTGTDSKLDSASHTSPNSMLSGYGNERIIHLLKGNEDAIAVKNREWQAWQDAGHGPETYAKFTGQFNKQYDPRVFQSQYMEPEQRQEMLKGMNKNEQTAFRKAYNTAVQKQWIPDPRAGNGG